MQPTSQSDAFAPKWRQFHPQSTVWITNPLEHDVEFKVADESNRQYLYVLGAGQTSELPGGAVATLGVKAVVDELIQINSETAMMWAPEIREKYETEIITRIKEAPLRTTSVSDDGETLRVDLSVKDKAIGKVIAKAENPTEIPFPSLKGADTKTKEGLSAIASNTLGQLKTVGTAESD